MLEFVILVALLVVSTRTLSLARELAYAEGFEAGVEWVSRRALPAFELSRTMEVNDDA